MRETTEKRCEFWLPKKKRHCANPPLNNHTLFVLRKSHSKIHFQLGQMPNRSVPTISCLDAVEDLNLNAVESLRGVPYLAIGKHLCGPATDLTLRCCLAENHDQDNGTQQSVRPHLSGIAVATCCHHLCQWKHYPNKRYLLNLGINRDDFHAITSFTSWAVDADHSSQLSESDESYSQSRDSPSDKNEDNGKGAEDAEKMIRNMKAIDRAAVGFMCKDIIDTGRLMWIKERGLEAKLVKYVPSNISPENRLLVAKQ